VAAFCLPRFTHFEIADMLVRFDHVARIIARPDFVKAHRLERRKLAFQSQVYSGTPCSHPADQNDSGAICGAAHGRFCAIDLATTKKHEPNGEQPLS